MIYRIVACALLLLALALTYLSTESGAEPTSSAPSSGTADDASMKSLKIE